MNHPHGRWTDWRWQIKHSVRRVDDLPLALRPVTNIDAMTRAALEFPLRITPYYLNLIDPEDPGDPILPMALPSPFELHSTAGLVADPIDEEGHSPVPGLIHRYPDRAVLLVSGRCAVNCRHCTRRGIGRGKLLPLDGIRFEAALEYLRTHDEIKDVILSGGDPLLLEDDEIAQLLKRLRSIPSIEILRIGSRLPVTLPMRITNALAQTLAEFQPLYVNTQFNHPREITDEAARALATLANAGIPLANQAVLLRGVNDRPETIEALCRALLRVRVRPYYLFLCDLWPGLEHLRTSVEVGLDIMTQLRGRLSGIGIPQLVVDLPGGVGKVPVQPNYVISKGDGHTVFRAPGGEWVSYPDPSPVRPRARPQVPKEPASVEERQHAHDVLGAERE